jgi:hypothetical protein
MITKGAAQQTWSQATQIHLPDDTIIPFAYDNIFKHTGSALRALSLSCRLDFASILRHLTDHCPELRDLSLSTKILRKFSSIKQRVAALLPRLTRFGVGGSIVRVFPKQVFEIFDCVPSQLNITELELLCCDVEDDHVDQFLDLINKMPCLQRLEARVPFSIVHGIQTLSKLENLSLIKRSNLFEDEAAVVEFLRPFASSKLGGNLNFLVGGLTYSLVAFLKQSKLLGIGILRVFESAGFTSKISIQTTAEVLRHVADEPNAFDTFFKVLCSNRHPLLPLTAELQPIAAEMLNSVVSHLPESSLKLLIETFGPMKTNPYSASTRLMTYPDRGAHIFELGLLSMDDLIHPKRDADNLFSFVTTEEQLEWLLSIMSKNDALRLLRRRAEESEDSSCPVIRLLSMDPCVSILSKWFEGLPIFVFDDAKERLSAYCSANSKSTVNLLFRHNADCMSIINSMSSLGSSVPPSAVEGDAYGLEMVSIQSARADNRSISPKAPFA